MDWLEASKVSYYKNDEVQKIIDDINQRTNSQMRCCRREFVCLFYDFIWNSPSCYWDNDVCTHFSSRLTTIVSQHPDIIISESMIEHFLSVCSTYSQITSIINDLDSINESDSIKNRLYRIPTYTSIVEGCLTNLFRFTVLLIDQFSVQNYSAQRKLEPLRTVLIKNGFSNGIESVDVKIRNSINHGGVIFREDGRVIEFHYMENSKSLSKELTVYEFDDLINKMYDITSAVLLSVCLFLNEHWDKISVNMSQKTFVSFALLSMKLSVPSIRCQFISDTASSKQLNADFYIVETDRTFIVETALKISLMIYSAYPDYDQYYLSFSSERLQKSWIRFTNSELAHGRLFRFCGAGLLGFRCLFLGLDCGGKVRQRNLFPGFCFCLQFAQRWCIVQHAINHIFVLFGGKFCSAQRIFPQELRHLLEAHTVAVVGGVLPILVQHHHIRNRQ